MEFVSNMWSKTGLKGKEEGEEAAKEPPTDEEAAEGAEPSDKNGECCDSSALTCC